MPTEVTAYITSNAVAANEFTLLSVWEADPTYGQRDLVSLDENQITKCKNDFSGGLTDTLVLGGWTTDYAAGQDILITADDADRHYGVSLAGFYISDNTSQGVIQVPASQHGVTLEWLEIFNTGTLSARHGVRIIGADDHIRYCLVAGSGTSGYGIAQDNSSDRLSALGNVVYNSSEIFAALTIAGFSENSLWAHNTIVNCGSGPGRAASNRLMTCNSTVSFNSDRGDWEDWLTANSSAANNASGDASAPGTNPVTGVTVADFVDFNNDDWRPAPGGKLDGAALTVNIPTAIAGMAINGLPWNDPPSIGAFEVEGGVPPATVTPDNVGQAQQADNLVLSYTPPTADLLIQSAESAQAAENITLTHTPPSWALIVESADNAQTSDNLTLDYTPPTGTVTPDSVSQAQQADNVVLTYHPPKFVLNIQGAENAQTAQTVTLIMPGEIGIISAAQAQTADHIDLVQHHTLAVDSAEQNTEADNVLLDVGSLRVIPDSVESSQHVDNIELVQHAILAIDSAESYQSTSYIDFTGQLPGRLVGDFRLQQALTGNFTVQ